MISKLPDAKRQLESQEETEITNRVFWINRQVGTNEVLPVASRSSFTAMMPCSDTWAPRLITSHKGARLALSAWKEGRWTYHYEDGFGIDTRRHQNRDLIEMETVEVMLQQTIDGKPMIFVFGSNEGGRHGAGAARYAQLYHGAQYGKGIGHYGSSYGIPTKSAFLHTLNLSEIEVYVHRFLAYAREHREYSFKITQIGCGLAGFKPAQIAPLFKDAPENCYIDSAWSKYLPNLKTWGTL